VADKEEVESTAEAGSSELSGPSQASADLKTSPTGTNGTEAATDEATDETTMDEATTDEANPDTPSGKVLEPAGVAAATDGASAKTATGRSGRAPKGAPTRKRDQRVKQERTTPVKFVRQSIAELRKVVYPTGQQLINYFVVVLVFVLFVIAYVSLLDLGLGWAIFKIFS
jgi:preprotein translocase subunit SecE